jgi:hypothetical protein
MGTQKMSRQVDQDKIERTHQVMLEYQAEHYGQAPGYLWLMPILGLHTTSAVKYRMNQLLSRKMVVKVNNHYVAIQPGNDQ